MEDITLIEQRNRLHPRKLMMWMAMASMFMVFAGLTSAFILQSGSAKWVIFKLPIAFWFSTIVIMASSYTMSKAVTFFKSREKQRYKTFVSFTLILGILFIVLQLLGFADLYKQNITLQGSASNGFLFIISGLHIAHMVGAIIALVIVYLTAFRKKVKTYNSTSIEIMSLFWHFVDGLWIYLFIFFLLNFKL
ncbi:MAG: cytochrome c oxidase subunit 3 [Chitinophagaceae bacterium]|jgi:cytochrome c oxidase subunit 3|nr:cytochrome c oxidase subunit 3 [Chitinophagaceae bacterium]